MEPKRLWGSENCFRGADKSVGPGCIVVQQVRINEKKLIKVMKLGSSEGLQILRTFVRESIGKTDYQKCIMIIFYVSSRRRK